MTMLALTNHYRNQLLERTREHQYIGHTRAHVQVPFDKSHRFYCWPGEFGPLQQSVWPRILTCLHCNLYTIFKISTELRFDRSRHTVFYFRVIRRISGILNYGQWR